MGLVGLGDSERPIRCCDIRILMHLYARNIARRWGLAYQIEMLITLAARERH
jgi:hypothetical protein